MTRTRRGIEIFSLSFLDVISCGFGAVLMLVLISHTSPHDAAMDSADISALLSTLFSIETDNESQKNRIRELHEIYAAIREENEKLTGIQQQLQRKTVSERTRIKQISDDIKGLELVESSLNRASISRDTATTRDSMSGGIPTDSDYVIFIVDTSGSMKQVWGKVMSVLTRVLDIHPEVKGFQVLSDNGAYLLAGYANKWIPDTPSSRRGVLKLLAGWNAISNSSPVEGLQVALKTYARSGKNISIYIFGDDYTGSSYEAVLNALEILNTDRKTGQPLVKVHGIGFISRLASNRFGILMREVARRNGGTFLALPVN